MPAIAARQAEDVSRATSTTPRRSRRSVEDDDDRSWRGAAMPLRRCGRAATATSRHARSISSYVVEEGRARLHRAHQYPRQHPHARLRHPPRVRYRRRRRLQPRADRSRRTPPEKSRTTSRRSRSPTSRASSPDRVVVNVDVEEQSTGEFSMSGGYSTAGRLDRRSRVGERNLLGRGQYVRVVGAVWPARQRLRIVLRRAVFPRLSRWRSASTCSRKETNETQYHVLRQHG